MLLRVPKDTTKDRDAEATDKKQIEAIKPLKAEFQKTSKAIRAEIKRYAEPMGKYEAGRARIVTSRNNGTRIIRAGSEAVTSWATTHSKLRVSLDNKTRLDVTVFAAAVGAIASSGTGPEREQ